MIAGTVQWGNVAEWAGAIGGTGAFFVALQVLNHERKDRAEVHRDRMADQARLVSAWCLDAMAHGANVTLHNRSDEPVYDVRVFLGDVVSASEAGHYKLPVLAPAAEGHVFVDAPAGATLSNDDGYVPVGLAFTDSRGRRWLRSSSGQLGLVSR